MQPIFFALLACVVTSTQITVPIYTDTDGNPAVFHVVEVNVCFNYNVFDDYYARVDANTDGTYSLNSYTDSSCSTKYGYYYSTIPASVLTDSISYDGYTYYHQFSSCLVDRSLLTSTPVYYYVAGKCGNDASTGQSIKGTISGSDIIITIYSDYNCQTESESFKLGACNTNYCYNGYSTKFTCEAGELGPNAGTGDNDDSHDNFNGSELTTILSIVTYLFMLLVIG
ncbi:hypothetical protein QTN25_010820 [Entamoeba marina]